MQGSELEVLLWESTLSCESKILHFVYSEVKGLLRPATLSSSYAQYCKKQINHSI